MRYPQKGFSLVELMIAITLALIVVGAIGYFYLGTRQAYRSTDNLSQLQENQRVALDVIARDIRMAGYMGCVNINNSYPPNVIAKPPFPSLVPATMAQIYKDGAGWTPPLGYTRVPNTDVIEVRFASQAVGLTSIKNQSTAQTQIYNNLHNFAAGDVMMVSDCSRSDIFRATSVSKGAGPINIAHGANSNTTPFLSKVYGQNAVLMSFHDVSYFIGFNATGNPTLYRFDAGAPAPEEIAENVENMQAQYILNLNPDTNNDVEQEGNNTNIPAGAKVVALQVGMAFVGTDYYVATAAQTYKLIGNDYGPFDTRLRQAANITVALRSQALF